MMKLYARLLPRMPRPGAPVCNWWAALGQFFFSSSRSNLPARPHVVVVAPRRALRGPHGSRIAGCRPRTQRPWRCAHSRSKPRTSSLRHQKRPRVVTERPPGPRHGPGSLTRSAHVRSAVSSNNQCQRPPPRRRPTPAQPGTAAFLRVPYRRRLRILAGSILEVDPRPFLRFPKAILPWFAPVGVTPVSIWNGFADRVSTKAKPNYTPQ